MENIIEYPKVGIEAYQAKVLFLVSMERYEVKDDGRTND